MMVVGVEVTAPAAGAVVAAQMAGEASGAVLARTEC